MSDIHLIEALCALNVFQFCFWGYQVHVLVNKAMSRDFAEYKFVKNGPALEQAPKDDADDFEEMSILNELNGLLPQAHKESAS